VFEGEGVGVLTVSHPLETARHLIAQFAPLTADRQVALDAIDAMLPYTNDDERSCADCGAVYYMTEPQREYFASRGLKEPVRCKPCRDARRHRV
jgi:hypothetical protein